MKHVEDNSPSHPNPMDRNRSILWARDLVELNDWVIISCKSSTLVGKRVMPGDAAELISIAVLGPGERPLLDVLVRPDGAVNSELLKIHGCDPKHAFNAPEFPEIYKILKAGFAKTRVICWNQEKTKEILAKLCKLEKLPELSVRFDDAQAEYSRFVGEVEPDIHRYKTQNLPREFDSNEVGITPWLECEKIYEYLKEIAAGHQMFDSASTFNKNWSAAFYKPKMGPAKKLKEILGLND